MPIPPLLDSSFSLDTSGVAGFFGEDEAVAAMASVHLFGGRKYVGWYNSPGSYKTAKRYGKLAGSRLWKGLYPASEKEDPVKLFGLDGKQGPKFFASKSGTRLDRTGYLAHLLVQKCTDMPVTGGKGVAGRKTTPESVTVVHIPNLPVDDPAHGIKLAPLFGSWTLFAAALPIVASSATCVACALYHEWYAFAMILLGMVANGVACFVLGNADLMVHHPKPAAGSPAGDGVLLDDKKMVILIGQEASVNYVTRGHLSLNYPSAMRAKHHDIGVSAFLLTVQFILQLLLIPQSSLFGQLLFLASLAVSWIYNSSVSSVNREDIQTDLIAQDVLRIDFTPKSKTAWKCKLGNHTATVVFVLCVLSPDETKARALLDDQLPDNDDWSILKVAIIDCLRNPEKGLQAMRSWQFEGHQLLGLLAADVITGFEQYQGWKEFDGKTRKEKYASSVSIVA